MPVNTVTVVRAVTTKSRDNLNAAVNGDSNFLLPRHCHGDSQVVLGFPNTVTVTDSDSDSERNFTGNEGVT